jgi:hypothetical protein
MASERRHDDADHDRIPDGLPNPLPPGWIFRPRSPNASIEELHKVAGSIKTNGPIDLTELFHGGDDAWVSDEEWQRWQREGLDTGE